MWTQISLIVFGSFLASCLTWILAYLFFEYRYKQRLREEVDDLMTEYQQRFQEILDAELEKSGDLLEQRVRQGVLDAVASLPSPEVLQETTKGVVRTGVDLVETGLSTLLGGKPKSR